MQLPFISVILPVRNEERYIAACVDSIFSQDYPADQMEVIFVDGRSEDRTVELLHAMQKEHPQIVVLDNPNRTVPYAMNIGIAHSSAPVIVRLDAHAEYPADYIRLSVETLLTKDCDNAGGVFETHGRGFMGEAIAEMLKTPLGVGNATYRLTTEDGYVDTVPFGCFKRALFDRIGGFDERMTRNQDNELNFRIRKPDIRNLRFRFALRQVIVLTPCLVLAYLWQTNNIYWLVISVFFMMIPFTEYTMQRVRQRVFGTMAGIVLSFILFTIFPDFTSRVVIMTAANFLIYAADGYGPTVAFITCSALALQSIDSNIPVVLTQRLIYTLLGGGIALLSNRYIFPVRLQKQMQYLFELLRTLREQLAEIGIHTTPGDDSRRHQIDQLIIKSYLLSTRAEDLQESLPEMQKYSDFEDARKQHMEFLASYLAQYMA